MRNSTFESRDMVFCVRHPWSSSRLAEKCAFRNANCQSTKLSGPERISFTAPKRCLSESSHAFSSRFCSSTLSPPVKTMAIVKMVYPALTKFARRTLSIELQYVVLFDERIVLVLVAGILIAMDLTSAPQPIAVLPSGFLT